MNLSTSITMPRGQVEMPDFEKAIGSIKNGIDRVGFELFKFQMEHPIKARLLTIAGSALAVAALQHMPAPDFSGISHSGFGLGGSFQNFGGHLNVEAQQTCPFDDGGQITIHPGSSISQELINAGISPETSGQAANQVAAFNNLTDANIVYPGDVLNVPASVCDITPAVETVRQCTDQVTVTIQNGDPNIIRAIQRTLGLTEEELYKYIHQIKETQQLPSLVHEGDTFTFPGNCTDVPVETISQLASDPVAKGLVDPNGAALALVEPETVNTNPGTAAMTGNDLGNAIGCFGAAALGIGAAAFTIIKKSKHK